MTQNELPVGWVKCTIKDIGNVVSGGTPSTKDDANFNGDIAWITPADLSKYNNKFIKRGKRNISEKGLNSSSAQLMPAGSVLFSSRAPVGYVVIAANPITTNQGFKNVVPFTGIFNEYVYYYLKSKKKSIESKASGTTFKEISGSKFSAIPFLLPPLAEQKRIVGKIEELFAEVDKGIDLLKQKQAELKKYRQSVLSAAFSGKLYKTTEWQTVQLKDVCEKITDGSHNPPPKQTTGIPMLSGQNIKNDTINFDDFRFISQKDYEREAKRAPISKNDVLLTIVGTIGQSAVVPESLGCFAIQRSIALIKPTTINSYFLKYYFDSPEAQYFFKQKERGTAQKGIYLTTLKEMSLPFPVHSEQEQIVAEIEQRFEKADILEKSITDALESAEKLKQSILKKAFEGKLVPQDPNDEPASVLLGRIKSEQSPKKGKKK